MYKFVAALCCIPISVCSTYAQRWSKFVEQEQPYYYENLKEDCIALENLGKGTYPNEPEVQLAKERAQRTLNSFCEYLSHQVSFGGFVESDMKQDCHIALCHLGLVALQLTIFSLLHEQLFQIRSGLNQLFVLIGVRAWVQFAQNHVQPTERQRLAQQNITSLLDCVIRALNKSTQAGVETGLQIFAQLLSHVTESL